MSSDGVQIYISEILILVAWFCAPAVLLAIGAETWFFLKQRLFRQYPSVVIVGYLITVLFVPVLSVALVAGGLGRSPLESHTSGIMVPWFWQSFIAAVVVGAVVVAWAGRKRSRQ